MFDISLLSIKACGINFLKFLIYKSDWINIFCSFLHYIILFDISIRFSYFSKLVSIASINTEAFSSEFRGNTNKCLQRQNIGSKPWSWIDPLKKNIIRSVISYINHHFSIRFSACRLINVAHAYTDKKKACLSSRSNEELEMRNTDHHRQITIETWGIKFETLFLVAMTWMFYSTSFLKPNKHFVPIFWDSEALSEIRNQNEVLNSY